MQKGEVFKLLHVVFVHLLQDLCATELDAREQLLDRREVVAAVMGDGGGFGVRVCRDLVVLSPAREARSCLAYPNIPCGFSPDTLWKVWIFSSASSSVSAMYILHLSSAFSDHAEQ